MTLEQFYKINLHEAKKAMTEAERQQFEHFIAVVRKLALKYAHCLK